MTPPEKTIVITGGSHGLGAEIYKFCSSQHNVIVVDATAPPAVGKMPVDSYVNADVSNWDDVQGVAQCLEDLDRVDVLINCAGVNEIAFLEDLTEDLWDKVMGTNAKGIYLMSRALLPFLSPGGTIINIVSNASHIPMTSSLAYNASKGAAHIMTKQMARELKPRHDITVIGVSPNKLKGTGMSKYIDERVCETRGWTPEEAYAYQLKSLPAGEETSPNDLARFIVNELIESPGAKFLNGCVIPYGA